MTLLFVFDALPFMPGHTVSRVNQERTLNKTFDASLEIHPIVLSFSPAAIEVIASVCYGRESLRA